ncbi:MAG: hypothetical protein ACRBM6_11620 [Geminicoccales bacterium]
MNNGLDGQRRRKLDIQEKCRADKQKYRDDRQDWAIEDTLEK